MTTYKKSEKTDFLNLYLDNNANLSKTCKQTGVPYGTARLWQAKDWFKQGWERFIIRQQMAITTKLLQDPDLISDSIKDVFLEKGDPKFASAKVKLTDSIMKFGSEPVIKQRPELTLIKQNNEITVNNIDSLPLADIMAIARGETVKGEVISSETVED